MTIKNWIFSFMAGIATAGMGEARSVVSEDNLYLITGSYAPASTEGIRVYRFDQTTGATSYVSGLRGVENPSFLVPDPTGTHIYAVGENDAATSTASSLNFDRTRGTLTLTGSRPTHGAAPCHIAVSPDGKYVVTANYEGGSLTIFPLQANGTLGNGTVVSFSGYGPVKGRQDSPHLHFISFTPDNRYLLANDLGTDCIHRFPLTADNGSLIDTTRQTRIPLPPGSGPRHMAFAPDGHMAYLITELSGKVVALTYANGDLKPVQYAVADSLGAQGSADIHLSPDGRYLYASNRLKGDGLAIFSVSTAGGRLTRVGYQPTGPHPRNFTITPNGKYLLVACRDTDQIQIFRRNPQTGQLTDTGKRIDMPKPVCLQWVRP